MNQSIAEQSNSPVRPRQSARAKRASSSRSTFCESRRKAPSPTGDEDLCHMPGARWYATRPTTWWRTSKPSIVWRFRRSSQASVGAIPSGSWPGERMRPSMNAVVSGLPKSWHTAPSIIVSRRARSRSPIARARLVDDHQRVHPHVAFRVPLGLLRAVGQRRHLRDERLDHAELEAERETDRRPLRQQQELLDLAQHALARQVVEGDAAAHALRRLVHGEPEPRRELQRAQDAQAVVGERPLVDHPQHARVEVAASAERIEVLAGERVEQDGVDGEVAPAARVFDGHPRVARDLEAAMPAADLRLATGEGHVHARHLVDRERLAHRVDAADGLEQAAQAVGRHAVHLEIDVGGGQAEEPIPHPSAGDERAAAGVAHGPRNGQRRPGQRLDRAFH